VIFFLNWNFRKLISGVERSSMNRLLQFKEKGLAAKIIIDEYSNRLYENVVSRGLDFHDFIGRYDFFQEAANAQVSDFTVYDRKFSGYTMKRVQGTADFRFYNNKGNNTIYIHCFEENGKIDYINYFDYDHNKTMREIYDVRGFKSVVIIFDTDGSITSKTYYTPTGKIAVQEFFSKGSADKSPPTLITVNYKGMRLMFYSVNELRIFFLEQLLEAYGDAAGFCNKDVFIYDVQRSEWANPLRQAKGKVAKVVMFHNAVVRNQEDPQTGVIKGYCRFAVKHLNDYDALVVISEEQKQDIIKRFDVRIPIYVIPGGYIRDGFSGGEKKIRRHKIISLARYAEGKRLNHAVLAFDKLKDKLPRAELHLFGAGASAVKKELEELIKKLKLENRVFIGGHIQSIEAQYNSADLFVLSGLLEGFPLALLEAASYRVPQVAYDIRYGPKDIIIDGKTGFLAADGDIDDLANKMYAILSDDGLRAQMSDNCTAIRERYSENKVLQKWSRLLNDLSMTR
jgi:poly(glycerol-phosphate) alpha-glucosyltransferase